MGLSHLQCVMEIDGASRRMWCPGVGRLDLRSLSQRGAAPGAGEGGWGAGAGCRPPIRAGGEVGCGRPPWTTEAAVAARRSSPWGRSRADAMRSTSPATAARTKLHRDILKQIAYLHISTTMFQ